MKEKKGETKSRPVIPENHHLNRNSDASLAVSFSETLKIKCAHH